MASRYDVMAARTGREALALAAHGLPQAVILDLSLPDIGGTEVIAKLRRWYQPPIIALSGQASSRRQDRRRSTRGPTTT